MNGKPVEPLSAEERELATLLGRTGPHGEPSPALDAKVLSAARAAVARDAARPAARRRRWPALAGLAASVLVAAGIAWQLRPQQGAVMQVGEAPASAAVVDEAPAGNAAASVDASPAPETPPAPDRSVPPPPAATERQRAMPTSAGVQEAPSVEAAEPRPTDIVAPAKAIALPPPPPPPPPPVLAAPAPPAPPAPVASHADEFVPEPPLRALAPTPAAAREEAVAARQQARSAQAASASVRTAANAEAEAKYSAADNSTLDSIVVTGTVLALADIPVAEDAKLSRADWLQRIRQRKAQGDEDGARESLRLFVGKHPRARLPSDLRGLLEE